MLNETNVPRKMGMHSAQPLGVIITTSAYYPASARVPSSGFWRIYASNSKDTATKQYESRFITIFGEIYLTTLSSLAICDILFAKDIDGRRYPDAVRCTRSAGHFLGLVSIMADYTFRGICPFMVHILINEEREIL